MRKAIRGNRRRSGFTLLEILIVVGIIALLAAFVVPNLMNTQRGAQVKIAQTAVDSNGPIATALKMYNLHMGGYPKELKELVEKPDGDDNKKWQGPYIEDANTLKDPWDQDYQYKFPGSNSGEDKYDLWSTGPDKQDGTDDDITSWKKQ